MVTAKFMGMLCHFISFPFMSSWVHRVPLSHGDCMHSHILLPSLKGNYGCPCGGYPLSLVGRCGALSSLCAPYLHTLRAGSIALVLAAARRVRKAEGGDTEHRVHRGWLVHVHLSFMRERRAPTQVPTIPTERSRARSLPPLDSGPALLSRPPPHSVKLHIN